MLRCGSGAVEVLNCVPLYIAEEELRKLIGADSLKFLSIDGLHEIAEGCNIGLCDGCFSGVYHADKPKIIFEDKFANKIKKF